LTKLQFTVWNANENSFTGAFECVDSVETVGLGGEDNSVMTARSNFDRATLKTANARLQVQGVASTQCPVSAPTQFHPEFPVIPATENVGLLGVITSSVDIDAGLAEITAGEDVELGSTTQSAGTMVGFVKWDPAGSTVPSLKAN
jgi:hypothetical protein